VELFIFALATGSRRLDAVDEKMVRGDRVRITGGIFKGAEGCIARVHGTKRFVVTIPRRGRRSGDFHSVMPHREDRLNPAGAVRRVRPVLSAAVKISRAGDKIKVKRKKDSYSP